MQLTFTYFRHSEHNSCLQSPCVWPICVHWFSFQPSKHRRLMFLENTHRLTFRQSCGTNALCSTFYIRTSVSGQKCCSSLSVFQIANLAHQRALCSVFALILLLEWNLLFGSAQLLLLLFLRSITVGLLFFLCCLAFICTEAQFHRHFAGCLSNTSTLHRPTSSLFGNAGSGGQYFFLTGCH